MSPISCTIGLRMIVISPGAFTTVVSLEKVLSFVIKVTGKDLQFSLNFPSGSVAVTEPSEAVTRAPTAGCFESPLTTTPVI
jgi:uncharacterized membrane protein